MTAITDAGNNYLRDYVVDGLPTSGDNHPSKSEGRVVFATIDIALGSLGFAGAITVAKATLALLSGDLDHDADTLAIVYNDATPANNGIFAKSGDAGVGSWDQTDIMLPANFAEDLATVLAQMGQVAADAAAAEASAAAAAVDAGDAEEAKDAAEVARDQALSAAEATGPFVFYDTKADANTALAGLPANQLVQVWVDESQGNAHTVYKKAGGVYVLKGRLSVSEARLTAAFGEAHNVCLLGDLLTRSIDTNLNGIAVPANLGQVYIGNRNNSADAITTDSSLFPGGFAFRRWVDDGGTPVDAVASGLQLGYLDFRALFEGQFFNAASYDVVIDGSRVTTTGCPPPTRHRWAISDGLLVYVAMELWTDGCLQLGAYNGEDYFGPAEVGGSCKLFVNQSANEYAAIVAARPASGLSYGLRLHTAGATNADFIAVLSSGAGGGSIRGVFTGAGRLGIDTATPVCAIDVAGPIRCGQYTVATVPLASLGGGQEIYVSDESGGAVKAFSDGANWRRCTDRAVIS